MANETHFSHLVEEFGYYLIVWLYYLAPILLVAGPIWFFGRKRTVWTWIDFAVIVLPYWIWVGLMMLEGRGKTLSNVFVEPFWLGVTAIVPSGLRLIVGKRMQSKWYPALFDLTPEN